MAWHWIRSLPRHDTSAMYEDTVVTLDALFRSTGGHGQ